jgi:nitrite reductase (NADH) large subunit
MSTERLVVIGNGMAGARAVEEILAGEQATGERRFEITVFGDEPCGNYNRILLSGVLSGAQDAGGIFLHPFSWYEENGVTLHAGDRVTAIDRENRLVTSASGRSVQYDRLLIATGSRPFVPPIDGLRTEDGAAKSGVFVFRTLEDCRRMAGYAAKCRRAVVVGGGLLGLEAAYGLKDHGVEVHVLQRSDRLMDVQLDAPSGDILRAAVESMGVRVSCNAITAAVLGDEQVTGLRLQDGTLLECDMVVLACGIQPNVELAAACGLDVERGIVVDDHLQCPSDPAVYSVGECAQHRGKTYGLVAPLWEQAKVLADHLTGRRSEAAYLGSETGTRLKVMGLEVASLGLIEPAGADDEVVQFIEPRRGVYKKLIIRDDRLVGAIILGDSARIPTLMQAFDRAAPLPRDRASLLFDLGGPLGTVSPDAMPDDATVCHCNGVSKGDIRECVLGGGASLSAVMRATRAGTGCGSCKGLVREFVERFRPAEGAAIPLACLTGGAEAAPARSLSGVEA